MLQYKNAIIDETGRKPKEEVAPLMKICRYFETIITGHR